MAEWTDKTAAKDRHFGTFWKGVKILWQLLGDQKKNIFLVLGLMVFLNILSLGFPYILKLIFDEMPKIISQKQIGSYALWLIGALFGVKLIASVIGSFVKEPLFLKAIIKLENWWPVIVQEKLLNLSTGYHERENTGKKIAKINKGCDKMVEILITLFWQLLPQLIYLMANIAIVVIIDWKLGIFFLLPIAPVVYIQMKSQKKFQPAWEKWEEKKERAGGFFCQSLLNISTVQNFVQEKKEKIRFAAVRNEMSEIDTVASLGIQRYFFLIGNIMYACFVPTICLGIYFVSKGLSTIGTVVYIVATMNLTSEHLSQMISNYSRMLRFMISIIRMKELLDEKIDIKNAPNAIIPEEYRPQIAMNHISFTYPGKETPVLDDVSIKIKPGEMSALVGVSGAGKTTLIRLLCRMYEADRGVIMLDNYDVRALDLYWYRRHFAIVQQDVDIFDDTLLANICYANSNASEEQVVEALRAAHLEAVLEDKNRFPNGLATEVGERGVKLSGGERQRVGIARAYIALLSGAKILILDEATSNLDSEAEKAIQEMIGALKQKLNISIVAIAHRLSTIHKANIIYVIEDGKIIEQGDHSHLVSLGGRYHHLVKLQKLANN
ncbi:MAG: ABC transporter ATP-binding protein [bacterium]